MIILYQFEPALGVRNPSPFCLKLETYLRMVNLPYEVAPNADVRQAPKKKLPYIQDGDRTIADSGFVIDYLKQTYGDPLDQHLSLQEQAISLAFQRLMEEHFYWVALYSRWGEEKNWPMTRQAFFSNLPPILRSILPGLVRKDLLRSLYGQGIGRHSQNEIYDLGQRDLKALSHFLSDKPFLMGEKPTSLDATGYGILANIIRCEVSSVLSDSAQQFDNLGAYCERMEAQFWS
jgi:glutathione S-transferase